MLFSVLRLLILIANCHAVSKFGTNTPLTPSHPNGGWIYAIEAIRPEPWPSCRHRFVSYTSSCGSNVVDLWRNIEENQQWEFVPAEHEGDDVFYIKRTGCSQSFYLSYDDGSDCNQNELSFSTMLGSNQRFRFVRDGDSPPGHYYIEAIGRVGNCSRTWLSFTSQCSSYSDGPDLLNLWSGKGVNQYFRIHPMTNEFLSHKQISQGGCADPYAWNSGDNSFHLLCTGGDLALYQSPSISESATFSYIGRALGGTSAFPEWLQNGCCRWAPENYLVRTTGDNIIFFSDEQRDEGVHRLGYVISHNGPGEQLWDEYSSDTLFLSNASGGEIDPHVFFDRSNDRTLLLWKSDDNRLGNQVTYLWAQQIEFGTQDGDDPVILVGSPQVLLDSTGLWWIKSWVLEGSLIEGPQMIYEDGWYFLFFASGKYCDESYAEGVARSRDVWGPYEKLGVPILSTGIVGTSEDGTKLIGPGHASFVKDPNSGDWYSVWHASIGYNCNRRSFASKLRFGLSHGWPIMDWSPNISASPTSSPSGSPTEEPIDNPDWLYIRGNGNEAGCHWVTGDKAERRCKKVGFIDNENVKACDACLAACNDYPCVTTPPCEGDNPDWVFTKPNGKGKKCDWIAKRFTRRRCKNKVGLVGNKQVVACEACCEICIDHPCA